MLSKLPKFVKSFYFIFAVLFFIWMVFFDSNDLRNQFRMNRKLKDLYNEKAYYQEKIEEVLQEREALLNNPEKLEKFARENYLMKKKTEDVFITREED
ncbi:MAG TPA: septum formation initiator family protein [Cytophagaceae bacterium]